MSKLRDKFDNFSNALKSLNEANIAYKKKSDNSIYQDALIKRYEFTFELAWKTLREFLFAHGYELQVASPKNVIAFAYQEGLLNSEQIWLDMLKARNDTSHDYGGKMSEEIAGNISNRYYKELFQLNKFISNNLK